MKQTITAASGVFDQKLSRAWVGYAAVLFMELGKLSNEVIASPKGDFSTEKGAFTIMIEGNWKLLHQTEEILDRMQSPYEQIEATLAKLVGQSLRTIQLDEQKNEYTFDLGNDYILVIPSDSKKLFTIFQKGVEVVALGD